MARDLEARPDELQEALGRWIRGEAEGDDLDADAAGYLVAEALHMHLIVLRSKVKPRSAQEERVIYR